ncbi:MAG: DUF1801 domain-containing protein [Lutibacter sp.]|uniref:DUF1801 domain-containing protein n=1 Tax=Lutibacter sp. TaxID=1925666 RepID=UPI0017AA5449|nr:DUF1801 domain-containing protein [Lutibacter sp.]MBT8316870.1 DUF1801 domain-containing protein [Lutibacter sp.]NNJ57730.1 DUF1801 domain-containing protein [Lutibacter sp.]
MQLKAKNPEEYIAQIPKLRIPYFSKLRETVLANIPKGFQEQISYGMIGYVVPKSIYPNGYHCDTSLPLPFVNIASQKNFIALYHFGIYANKEILDWFVNEYPKHSKRKLDMGKSCIRFKNPEEIPFELIAKLMQKITVDQWINIYEKNIKK